MKDQYKYWAKWYDCIFGSMNLALRQIGLKMYPPKAGMDVLDMGCGTGVHLKLYQEQGCQVYGVDLSDAMLEVARKTLGDEATLKKCDANNTGFPDNHFDLVLSCTVLHEMSPEIRTAVLQEALRICKHDGRLLIIDFHNGPIKKFKGILSKIIITIAETAAGGEHYRNYRHFMKNGALPELIKNSGFTVEHHKIVSGGNMGIFLLRRKDEK
jgi:demethylmenaquinone methyltransferase/2-methoxy-6-polyprenyl-1,4-benzoquinol methylase